MAEFNGETATSSAQMWRDREIEGSRHNTYDQFTPPPVSEVEEWRSGNAEDHGMGSPHSQSSVASMVDSPQSSHASVSENRRSVDATGDAHNQMSLSERRQEKRKMKRFRLTHNQTRFLMSEFARQAHPDAAHRERLAREIPGLSPRQVQVWFQNRRAKLKRMSSDDRERMMKSRALPEEFPILQTLHTYGSRMMGTPVASPTEYSPNGPNSVGGYHSHHHHRPDPLRRSHLDDDVAVSPTTRSYSGMSFTPTTPSSSDMMSPVSSAGERHMSYPGYMTAPLGPQQNRGNPFTRPNHEMFRGHPSVPRLQMHDTPRSMSEHVGSPLATSTSYSSSSMDHGDYQSSPGGYSISSLTYSEPPRSVPDTPQSPYVHSNPSSAYSQPYPSPATASTHPRTSSFPPPLTLSEFKYPSQPLTPHSGTMSGFATAPLAPPQEYQIPQMSAPADSTTFSSSYLSSRGTGSLGSATQSGAPGHPSPPERSDRLSLGGRQPHREFGHRRQRSSSHPPNFPQHREQ